MNLAATAPSAATSDAFQDAPKGGIIVIGAGSPTPLGPTIILADEEACRLTGFDQSSLVGSPLGLIYDRSHLPELIRKLPSIAERPDFCWMDRELNRNSNLSIKVRWTIRPTRHKGQPSGQFFTLTFLPLEDLHGEAATEKDPEDEVPIVPVDRILRNAVSEETPPTSEGRNGSDSEVSEKEKEFSISWSASAVAHDFKNVLQKIMMNLDMAMLASRQAGSAEERLKLLIGKANVSLGEAEQLARQLFDFAKGVPPENKVFDLKEVLTNVVRFASAGGTATIRPRIHPQLRPVEGDPDQIFRVFQNLLINANQAMPNGGTIDVSATNREYTGPNNEFGLATGNYTVISIRDRGIGISAEALPHIFSPGFSTKSNGYGFGLASCKAAVEAHGGEIRVASRPKVGTQFLIFLPSSNKPLTVEKDLEPVDPQRNPRTGGDIQHIIPPARILVVEDEAGVSESTQLALNIFGHTSYAADTGEKALRIFRSHLDSEEPIDLVLLDMSLPGGMDGIEVFAELQRLDSSVPVIATSGHFDENASVMVTDSGFAGMLAKPFNMESLKLIVSTALAC